MLKEIRENAYKEQTIYGVKRVTLTEQHYNFLIEHAEKLEEIQKIYKDGSAHDLYYALIKAFEK